MYYFVKIMHFSIGLTSSFVDVHSNLSERLTGRQTNNRAEIYVSKQTKSFILYLCFCYAVLFNSLASWADFLSSANAKELIDWVKVLHLTQHKIVDFGDVLPSQSLRLVLNNAKENLNI